MKKIAKIGSLLKKSYRNYSNNLLLGLQSKGYIDLRPSFLEILTYICENEGDSIRNIGIACGLKKQTMTSHLNELEKRGYISRVKSSHDKRELLVNLTPAGQNFKLTLLEVIDQIEQDYLDIIGELEMDRVSKILENFYDKTTSDKQKDSEQGLLI